MRPILSATNTYNYKLAKWLDQKLKPLIVNKHVIDDVFKFVDDIKRKQAGTSDILVSYNVTSLFTNVPVDETIDYIVEKPFKNNWFNETYELNLTKKQLTELLGMATKNQLYQLEGQLFQQIHGVAMGTPWGLSWQMP